MIFHIFKFNLAGLIPGYYSLTVQADGYAPTTQKVKLP